MLSRHWAVKIDPSFSSYPELTVCLLSDEFFLHPVLIHKGGRVGDSNREQSPLDQKNEVTHMETCMSLWPLSANVCSTNCNYVMVTWGDYNCSFILPAIVTLSPTSKPPSINSTLQTGICHFSNQNCNQQHPI